MKKAANEALDTALYLWFIQKRSEGIPLSGPIIAAKAIQFNMQLNGDANFKASTGWLDNFKNRHGIRELNIQGEKLSAANAETVNNFKRKFDEMITEMGLCRDQVYNADETGLNYKALPTKTLATLSEKFAPGYKMQKQRLTAMVCANASGNDRLPLLIIEKSKKPRYFKNTNMKSLPVNYYDQKSAWMDQKIFTDWFHKVKMFCSIFCKFFFFFLKTFHSVLCKCFFFFLKKVFVPHVRKSLKSKNLPMKAILILDNAPAHPELSLLCSDDGNITCFFLPANTTSLLQPMDQSVIETFKRRYRKKFIENLVMEEDVSLIDYWKSYNLKFAVNNSADAWAAVSEDTLKKAWNKLWPETEEISESTECASIYQEIVDDSIVAFVVDETDIGEWLLCDTNAECYRLLTDEEIIEVATETENDSEIENDSDFEGENETDEQDERKAAREAVAAMETYLNWYTQQEEAEKIETMQLGRLRSFAVAKSNIVVKQTKISDFFKTN